MDLDTVLTALVAVSVAILCAGIPWAYSLHGRLTRIETMVSHSTLDEEVDGVRTEIRTLKTAFEKQCLRCETRLCKLEAHHE